MITNHTKVFRIGSNGPTTLFFGDSNIEQYAPRVVEVFKTHDLGKRGAIFLTGGSCPPFPWKKSKDRPWCKPMMETLLVLAQDKQIDRIVLGDAWYSYINENTFSFNKKDTQVMKRKFEKMLDAISMPGRKIYMVLNIPSGQTLDPSSFIKRTMFGIEPKLQPVAILRKTDFIHQNKLAYQLLQDIAKRKKLITVNPLDFLCDEKDLCLAFDSHGNAKYIDVIHLRPEFVKKHIHYIDQMII